MIHIAFAHLLLRRASSFRQLLSRAKPVYRLPRNLFQQVPRADGKEREKTGKHIRSCAWCNLHEQYTGQVYPPFILLKIDWTRNRQVVTSEGSCSFNRPIEEPHFGLRGME